MPADRDPSGTYKLKKKKKPGRGLLSRLLDLAWKLRACFLIFDAWILAVRVLWIFLEERNRSLTSYHKESLSHSQFNWALSNQTRSLNGGRVRDAVGAWYCFQYRWGGSFIRVGEVLRDEEKEGGSKRGGDGQKATLSRASGRRHGCLCLFLSLNRCKCFRLSAEAELRIKQDFGLHSSKTDAGPQEARDSPALYPYKIAIKGQCNWNAR